MNYSDICEQLLRNHFCLPERGKSTKHTEHCWCHTDCPCRYPLLMPWVPFNTCPLGLDHTRNHRCALGYFPFGHWAFFGVLMNLPFVIWMKALEGEAFGCGLVLSRQMQTPPSSSSFLRKLHTKLLLKLNMCSIWSLYMIFYLFSGEHNSKWSSDQLSTASVCPVLLMWSPFYGLKDKHSLRLWRSCYKWHGKKWGPLQEKPTLLVIKLKCPLHPSKQLRGQHGSELESHWSRESVRAQLHPLNAGLKTTRRSLSLEVPLSHRVFF